MRTEVPVLQRCCFCLPLRYGLIAWGYFKLIIASLILLLSLFGLYQVTNLLYKYKSMVFVKEIIIFVILLCVSVVDITLHVIFIVGGHKKNVKFLRIYYIYGVTLLVLSFLLGIVTSGIMIKNMTEHYSQYLKLLFISNMTTMVLNMLIQGYVIILVRSEIVKLNNYSSFRFVNNTIDAECNLNIENIGDQAEEKEKNIN